MLRASELAVHLGGRSLFRSLSAEFPAGSITAVVGPNGAGKSTLLRCLAGLHVPEHGEIELDGSPLQATRRRDRARVLAYLPQQTPLYHDLSVTEVVMLGRLPHVHRMRGPAPEDHEHADAALRDVGATALARRRISTLSGGERQRIMLARMLATEARWLLLDEPTAALDIGHALRFLALLRDLATAGRGIVVALHDLDLADQFADAAICLHGDAKGSFDSGPPRDVFDPATIGRVFGVHAERTPAGRLHLDLRR